MASRFERALRRAEVRGNAVGAQSLIERVEARLNNEVPSPIEQPSTPVVSSAIESRRSTMNVDDTPTPGTTGDGGRFRPKLRPIFAFAGMALLIIAVLGVGAVLLGGAEGPVADTPATGTDAITNTNPISSAEDGADETAPSPSTTLGTPLDVVTWTRVGEDVMTDTLGLFDITSFEAGFAAVGWSAQDGPAVGTVYLSDDGTEWRQVATDSTALTSSTALLYSVTETDNGLIAAGVGCQSSTDPCVMSGAPWISQDGFTWTRASHDAEVFGDSAAQTSGIDEVILTNDGTLLAVGATDTWTFNDDPGLETVETSPTVWASTDGFVWEKVWEGEGVELVRSVWDSVHTSPMLAVAQNPDGAFVAVGKTLSPLGTPSAAAWTSEDGFDWEPVLAFETTFGQNTTMTDIAWGPDGFVIVGTEGGHTPAIWTSISPSDWTRTSMLLQPFDGIGSLSAIAALDDGYVIAGPHPYLERAEGVVTVWTSADGLRWDRIHNAGPGSVTAVLASEQQTMLAGTAAIDGDWQGSVWVGPTLDPTNPPPDPGTKTDEPTQGNTEPIEGAPLELTPLRWTIDLNISPGVHRIFTTVEARPLDADRVAELTGSLVWDDTVVDLCNISIRYEGDGYLTIGDGFQTDEPWDCAENPTEMQEAFDSSGLPRQACVGVLTVQGHRYEYCAPFDSD